MSTPIRVLVADDQALVRAGFRMILNTQADISVVAEACNGEEAVHAYRESLPDVVLMDIRMPVLDGLEATRRILNSGVIACRVVMLTTFDLDEYVYASLRLGASGFLLKDVSPEQLIAAVRQVTVGDALLAPSITRRLVERFAHPMPISPETSISLSALTARERDVLRMLGRGMSNREIADALFVGETTVKTHVTRIFHKLDLRDRAGAVVFAYESGVVSVGSEGQE